MQLDNFKIAIIGLGYVGLPLAIEFGKKYEVIGFDINEIRVKELSEGIDQTNEADLIALNNTINLKSKNNSKIGLSFSSNKNDISDCNIYIVTVPTPIDQFKAPDLKPLIKASEMIGVNLRKNDIVIYESTVYPGCTEEDCVPVLEKKSGLKFNVDFYCGIC
jgi:UDP-N-acetyl-D-galactosamine dehydrogenase